MAERVAFLGLGVMGAPMAGHLAAAGLEVVVYNRTAEKARAWAAAHGGHAAPTPGEAADGATFVAACVLDDATLRAVTVGTGGAFEAMRPGAGRGAPATFFRSRACCPGATSGTISVWRCKTTRCVWPSSVI